MKKVKKFLVLLVAFTLLCSGLLTGCGKSGDTSTGTATNEASVVQQSDSTKSATTEVLPKELVVSSFNWGWPTVDDNIDRIGPELEKALGFKVKLNVIKAGSSDEADKKLQLWAATGAADMPDILMTTSSTSAAQTIDTLGRNGMLKDWKEFIDKMPSYKSQVDFILPLCSDVQTKKLFRVPQNFGSSKANKPGATPLIRKDWLDQLGLSIPKTTDELYAALKAFKEKIKLPDGKSVIPIVDFGEMFWSDKYMFDNPEHSLASSGNVTYGLNDWFTDQDGVVKRHDMVYSDNLFQYISFYNKLYKEGLLDKECFTMKYGQFEEKLASGRVGAFSAWGGHVTAANDALAKIDSKALFVGCYVFDGKTNPNLDSAYIRKGMMGVNSYWIVKNSIPEDQLNGLVKYFEYAMSDEGWKLTNYGQEGKDWEYDADKKIVDTKESAEKYKGNLGAKVPEGIWYYSPSPNYDLQVKYYAPTAYDKRADILETLKNIGYRGFEDAVNYSYITDKAPYVLPGPIETKKGAGYGDRWKDMVVKGVLAKSDDEIKQIISKWQETEKKLGYDEISKERTENLKTIPELAAN